MVYNAQPSCIWRQYDYHHNIWVGLQFSRLLPPLMKLKGSMFLSCYFALYTCVCVCLSACPHMITWLSNIFGRYLLRIINIWICPPCLACRTLCRAYTSTVALIRITYTYQEALYKRTLWFKVKLVGKIKNVGVVEACALLSAQVIGNALIKKI